MGAFRGEAYGFLGFFVGGAGFLAGGACLCAGFVFLGSVLAGGALGVVAAAGRKAGRQAGRGGIHWGFTSSRQAGREAGCTSMLGGCAVRAGLGGHAGGGVRQARRLLGVGRARA